MSIVHIIYGVYGINVVDGLYSEGVHAQSRAETYSMHALSMHNYSGFHGQLKQGHKHFSEHCIHTVQCFAGCIHRP